MEGKEKKAQELYMEYQALDQHIKQLQKQLEMLTGQLMELNGTSNSLDEFSKITPGKEIFVPLSSGIFAKASMKETSELLVNVGANVVVTRDISSTKKLIHTQTEEIKKMHKRMMDELEKATKRAGEIEMQMQSIMPQG